jgi:tetratricopeptide (TPR) repeat protein
LLVLAAFLPAIGNDFVGYDDPEYVTANPHIQQGLTWETVEWAFSSIEVAAWHPLTWLSHAFDYQCFGLRPWGHHLTSILLHAFNAVFCFVLLRRLTGTLWRSWAVAALFALHPLRVESVAWVSERKDVLSMAFFLLTLWAYTRYGQATEAREHSVQSAQQSAQNARSTLLAPRSTHYCLALFFFAFGLMSKPMLVTVPFVLLLLDFWPLHRWIYLEPWKLVREKIPFLVASVAVSLVTVKAQPGTAIPGSISVVPRLENAAVSYCRYLAKLFWPVKLAPFYPPIEHWPAMVWFGAVLLLVLVTLAIIWARSVRPYLLVGWLWFLVTLSPVIGVLKVGEQSVTDRYSYIPSLGIFLGLIWGINELTARWRFRALALALGLTASLLVCFTLTRSQLATWHNTETLFRHTLSVTTQNYLAHNNLGVVLSQQGHWPEAISEYQLALGIKPDYPEALLNLGVAFDHLRQLDKSIECYLAALKQKPNFAAAHNGLGLVYEEQGRFEDAAGEFQEAIRCKPDYADAHFQLALELERQGKLDQAMTEFQSTLKLQPNSSDVHNNLGVLFEKQGRLDAAILEYQASLQLNPNFARASFNLGVALTRKGMVSEAINAFEKALDLNPDYPAARTNLAILKSLNQPGTTAK